MIRLKVLGRIQLLQPDGQPVELKGVRDRALLVFLALRGGLETRERIVGLLWEDRAEEQARQSLRQSLSALRRAGIPVIADGKAKLALGSGLSCDAVDFARLATAPTLDHLRDALALYDGPLCADWHGTLPAFETWMEMERRRLAEIAVSLSLRLARWTAPPPPPSERLFLSRKALDIDPYLEPAHRIELGALADLGLRGEALLRHQVFVRRLSEDLGIAPEPDTLQTATGLGEQKRLRPEAPAAPHHTHASRSRLCVFNLTNATGQAALDYLSTGIMNEIAAALSCFHSFDVLPPAAAAGLRHMESDPFQSARERLKADFVLDGALAGSGAQMRVELYLHSLSDGRLIWTWRSPPAQTDYLALNAEVAHAVAQRIDSRIEEVRSTAMRASSPAELEGYDLWLKAQHLLVAWNGEQDDEAEALLQRALAASPRLARAHSSLALLYNAKLLLAPGYAKDAEDRRKALDHARLAVDCDPQDPRSHLAMMWVALWMCDHPRAQRHMQLAHELNPHSADVLIHVALVKANLGDAEGAVALATEAKALNPLFPDWYSYMHAVILVLAEDYVGALAVGLPIAREYFELPGWLAVAAAQSGNMTTAGEMGASLHALTRDNWVGVEPWSPRQAVEWFISVNRWVRGRERQIVETGLRKSGLLDNG